MLCRRGHFLFFGFVVGDVELDVSDVIDFSGVVGLAFTIDFCFRWSGLEHSFFVFSIIVSGGVDVCVM